eukprot:CAMPEP_0170239938 /NCGR_PEP_ID=MMETSP0116_2-20130129/19724_1 /TAXON_ID=400756 /ORGANISM="Durinskia baltica, Strain CSIRO CS-38" /LENGTH=561 /DNA_ID=CAMNT_0010490751 /DNA_START=86 /DNA_END=1769 /DNA_ORIENTATION=-
MAREGFHPTILAFRGGHGANHNRSLREGTRSTTSRQPGRRHVDCGPSQRRHFGDGAATRRLRRPSHDSPDAGSGPRTGMWHGTPASSRSAAMPLLAASAVARLSSAISESLAPDRGDKRRAPVWLHQCCPCISDARRRHGGSRPRAAELQAQVRRHAQRMLVGTETDIEGTTLHPSAPGVVLEVPEHVRAHFLRLLELLRGAHGQHLLLRGREGALCAVVEEQLPVLDPGTDALIDREGCIVGRVAIEIAAPSVLVRLLLHGHAEVDIVAPTEHRHADAHGQLHVDDMLLPLTGRMVHEFALGVVGDRGNFAHMEGAGKVLQNRAPVHSDGAVLEVTDNDDMPLEERPTHGDLVGGGQAFGILRSTISPLDPDRRTLHNPKLSLPIERGVAAIEGVDVGITPIGALAMGRHRDRGLRRRRLGRRQNHRHHPRRRRRGRRRRSRAEEQEEERQEQQDRQDQAHDSAPKDLLRRNHGQVATSGADEFVIGFHDVFAAARAHVGHHAGPCGDKATFRATNAGATTASVNASAARPAGRHPPADAAADAASNGAAHTAANATADR